MKEQHIFLFAYSLLVGGACLLMPDAGLPPEKLIAGVLVLACLLGVRLLLQLAGRSAWLCTLPLAAAFAAAMALGGMFPFAAVLLALAALQLARGRAALMLGAVSILLLGLILWPPAWAVLFTMVCTPPLLFLDNITLRLERAHEQVAEKADESDHLRQQLAGQRKMAGAMEHAARLSERNRLAARIHDEVGHGVSGSVLLLEGARLCMDKDPQKAKAALETATQNLRAAVDDIRTALREERAAPGEAGLAQVAALLTRFEAQHPAIHTQLATEGEVSGVSPLVWVCIQENLTEALTNLLKHSNATHFSVSIALHNKLVRATFRDDGAAGDFKPGMGLAAMEERCAMCHGRCFFSSGPKGFSTVMAFTSPKENTFTAGGGPT